MKKHVDDDDSHRRISSISFASPTMTQSLINQKLSTSSDPSSNVKV
ncbi:unnamed protein product, partial [Rotaria magnacalcarata]